MIEFDESVGVVLRIQLLRILWDENVYECVVQNLVGEIIVYVKFIVFLRGLVVFCFFNIDMGLQLKVVEWIWIVIMFCVVSGNFDFEIIWFKDFLFVDFSVSNGCIKQL